MPHRAIIHRLMEGFTSCPHYTDAIGQDLGIVPIPDNSDHPVPQFTAALEQGPKGNRVRIDYTKYGHQGVAIESRSNLGEWGLLGHFTQKPVYDDRPLAVPSKPETCDCRMRWWDKDEANGEWSAVQTVLVGGKVWTLAIADDLVGILEVLHFIRIILLLCLASFLRPKAR